MEKKRDPSTEYIDAKTFKDFCANQEKLIDIYNHRMTKVEECMLVIKNDVNWTKKLLWGILGVLIASLIAVLFKSAIGV